MDFFHSQDVARRNTRRLVVLFFLAVVAIVVAVYLAVVLILFGGAAQHGAEAAAPHLWDPVLFVAVAVGTLTVISGGSLYKTWQLSSGGKAVARLLGGRPIDPNTRDLDERRVLNVVEEMALAAGLPVPTVYLLPERAINAFAAGHTASDAVVGITEGAVHLLSRDELQGVVGHELSHVLNGDMRLNLRLMGILHGILVISLLGYFLMRTGGFSSGRRRDNRGGAAILFLGLALYLIGWIGVFFGRLIKAGVSRQCELLADAAAVQFTRNPAGLAGALKKIGGYSAGSRLTTPNAEQASHLYFANGMRQGMVGLLATHPPLLERIRRLDPSFDGEFPEVEPWDERPQPPPAPAAGAPRPAIAGIPAVTAASGGLARAGGLLATAGMAAVGAAAVTGKAGAPREEHLSYATSLLAALPAEIQAAVRDPAGARAVVYGLLLDRAPEARRVQMDELERHADPLLAHETRQLLPRLDETPVEARLPLLDLSFPALRRLSEAQYRAFRQEVERLVEADGERSLFEYVLERSLLRHLDPHFTKPRPEVVQYYSLRSLGKECSCLLAALARAGDGNPEAIRRAFDAGAAELAGTGAELALPEPLPAAGCSLESVDRALAALATVAPRLKRKVLEAAVAVVERDGRVTVEEGELLRAIADSLDVPVPPLLPGWTAAGERASAG